MRKVKMKTAPLAPRIKRQSRARFASRPKKAEGPSSTPAVDEAAEGSTAGHGPSGPDAPDVPEVGGDAGAELEAVIGATEEDEPAEKREAEEPSNFLAM